MNGILDTAIVVDLLRAHPPALAWLAGQDRLALTPIVWLEIIEGAANGRAQRRAIELLRRFERIDPLPEDFDWAIDQALRFKLGYNTDMMDCLIASAAQRLQLPLYTQTCGTSCRFSAPSLASPTDVVPSRHPRAGREGGHAGEGCLDDVGADPRAVLG